MDFFLLAIIGVVMGLFGGLLGIGGSVVMIPAMIWAFGVDGGQKQHLYQASAMICNFFVAISAVVVHRKKKVLVIDVVKWLVPAGVIAILAGVWLSNINLFSGANGRNLTRVFGFFMIYIAAYNIFKFGKADGGDDGLDLSKSRRSPRLSLLTGAITGLFGGLLGMGGGTVSTPMQQFFLKIPLKRAISNSSALIASMALIGAFYKNITLAKHGVAIADSIKIAVVIIPTAMIASFIGGRLMHKLPKDIVRAVFIVLLAVSAFRLLTV